MSKGICVKVEHVKAHRTNKEGQKKKEMSQFEKFVAEGNEKADELVKAGAMLDEGFMADSAARERRSARRLAVRSQLSLLGGGMERL